MAVQMRKGLRADRDTAGLASTGAPRLLSRFAADRSGGVAVMAGLLMPVMIGMAALATEYGSALNTQTEHQRVSDLASYAGAVAYGATRSEPAMRASARRVAALHGIAPADVSVELTDSPRTPGMRAVQARIATPRPLLLAGLLGAGDLTIAASALTEIGEAAAAPIGCVMALDPNGTGITLSGGTALNAPSCTVASNAAIASPCGTKIVTKAATYNSASAPVQPEWCKTIQDDRGQPAPIGKAPVTDPLAGHAEIVAATGRIPSVAALVGPSAPSAVSSSAPNVEFPSWEGNDGGVRAALKKQDCDLAWRKVDDKLQWTVTCSPGRTSIEFGHLKIGGSQTVFFNVAGSASTRYAFDSIQSEGGGNFVFGPGTFSVPGGVSMGGSRAEFGAGTFRIGRGACGYSICGGNNGTMNFAGPSVFELSHGIVVKGSLQARLGAGRGNVFRSGPSSDGHAIRIESGSLIIADGRLGQAARFETKGKVVSDGGTCLALPAAAEHDLSGNVEMRGALELGAGNYTVDGFLALGESWGGAAACNGRQTSLLAENVTITLSGRQVMTSWACNGTAFCAGAGYKDMVLTAPTSGPRAQLALIGPVARAGGAAMTSGAGNATMTGAFYFPKGPIKLDGGASVAGAAANCLMMVGTSVTIAGGSAIASECESLRSGGGSGRAITRLVQ